MARPALLETLHRMAEPVVRSKGLIIWGIEILQAGRPLVRIFVDTPPQAGDQPAPAPEENPQDSLKHTSATIDQCAEISRILGLAMEVEDVFASAYVLEVSSPGLSRPFFQVEQLPPYVGELIEFTLNEAQPEFPGRKRFRGKLLSVSGQTFHIALEDDEDELSVDWDNVRKAARVHVFVDPVKPGKRKEAKNSIGK